MNGMVPKFVEKVFKLEFQDNSKQEVLGSMISNTINHIYAEPSVVMRIQFKKAFLYEY